MCGARQRALISRLRASVCGGRVGGVGAEILKKRIASDTQFGLPSLAPKRKIDVNLMTFDSSSTVADVFTAVWTNAVLA